MTEGPLQGWRQWDGARDGVELFRRPLFSSFWLAMECLQASKQSTARAQKLCRAAGDTKRRAPGRDDIETLRNLSYAASPRVLAMASRLIRRAPTLVDSAYDRFPVSHTTVLNGSERARNDPLI